MREGIPKKINLKKIQFWILDLVKRKTREPNTVEIKRPISRLIKWSGDHGISAGLKGGFRTPLEGTDSQVYRPPLLDMPHNKKPKIRTLHTGRFLGWGGVLLSDPAIRSAPGSSEKQKKRKVPGARSPSFQRFLLRRQRTAARVFSHCSVLVCIFQKKPVIRATLCWDLV